ncbi:MAG TPA: carboxypeptidase regulatory-like domain-containing protein, partial [Pyrinomonadaceae bacterium]
MNSLKLEPAPRFVLAILCLFLFTPAAVAQHIRGALEGRVVDPNGAFVTNAQVKARHVSTNTEVNTTTNESGAFSFRNLEPGEYEIAIEGSGFRSFLAKHVIVKVGSVTPFEARLEIGEASAVIQVTADTEAIVDNVRHTVDGVITTRQIDNLPLNGRNFLDLAQLEPGVQTRDGGDFDPTKNQFVGVSIGGRGGRATRIQVDGVDITDETVGTTTANLSNES